VKTPKAAEARREEAKEMILDAGIYSGEAVKLAAFVFSDKADIRIAPGKGILKVSIKADDAGRAAGDFLNEVLNQQCRIDLAKKNSKIAGIIVTKALLSAAGEK
jgi:His-Xaa-Ser system protein HxsD